MAPTTLSNYIAEMRSRGHLEELPNPLDGRSRMLLLTADGRAAQKRANRAFELAYAPFARRIADPGTVKQALIAVEVAARDTRLELREKPPRRRRSGPTADTISDRAFPR